MKALDRAAAEVGRQNYDCEVPVRSEDELGRLHAPIGLAIGAQTVPEIAVSIVGQLIAIRRGK